MRWQSVKRSPVWAHNAIRSLIVELWQSRGTIHFIQSLDLYWKRGRLVVSSLIKTVSITGTHWQPCEVTTSTCCSPVSGPGAHCTLWHWIFGNFAKATRQAPARSLPSTWGGWGDTRVTSINNYPDTMWELLMGVCGVARLTGGTPRDLGHVFGCNDT